MTKISPYQCVIIVAKRVLMLTTYAISVRGAVVNRGRTTKFIRIPVGYSFAIIFNLMVRSSSYNVNVAKCKTVPSESAA